MWKWGRSRSKWNGYSHAAHKGDFFKGELLTRRYIFQLMKYENKGVNKSTHSKNRNFSSFSLAELLFLKRSQLYTLITLDWQELKILDLKRWSTYLLVWSKFWYGVNCVYFEQTTTSKRQHTPKWYFGTVLKKYWLKWNLQMFVNRISHWRSSIKKAAIKYFAIFIKNHLCWSLFIAKLSTSGLQLF